MLDKLKIGATVPIADEEQEGQLAVGTAIPIGQDMNDTRTVYVEDKDQLYNYPVSDDEDSLNMKLQTEVYGEDKNKFFMGVDTGIDVIKSFGQGAAAFFPSAALRTLGGTTMMTGELAEEGPDADTMLAARGGMPGKAIFDTVLSIAAKHTDIDDDIAQAGKDLMALSNEVLNNSFFKPGESTTEQVAFDLGGATASLFTSVGLAALTKNLNTSSVLFGQIAASETYVRGREEGKSPQESYQAALINFFTEAGLEYAGLEAFTKYLRGSKTITRIFAKAGTEFFQEAGQTLGSELSAKVMGFGEDDWGRVMQDMLYSGAIGFVTGGMGGAVQVVRENRSVMGEWRKAGFSDAEITEIIEPVMKKAYDQQFKAAVFNSLQREMDSLRESAQDAANEQKIVTDEDGNPVIMGMDEKDQFRYHDKRVVDLEEADRYARTGEAPVSGEVPGPVIAEKIDPAVQARIDQLEAELKPLYQELAPLVDKADTGELTKAEVKKYRRLQKEVARREVERDEVGYEWSEGTLDEAPVEGRKPVRMTAGQLARMRTTEVREQIRQFKAGFRAGKVVTKEEIKAFQGRLIKIINMSDVLTDKQKNRMLKTVDKTQTETKMNKRVLQLEQIIRRLEHANARKTYSMAIQRILKVAKKKKLDASTRTLFNELLALNEEQGLDPDKLQAAYDGTIESVLRYDIAILNSAEPSLQELRTIYKDLKHALEFGINTRKVERENKKKELEANLEIVNKEIAGKEKVVKADPNAQEQKKSRRRVWPIGMFTFDTIVNRITRGTGKKEGTTWLEKRLDTFNSFLTKTKVKYLYDRTIQAAYQEAFGLAGDKEVLNRMFKDQSEKQIFTWIVGEKEEIIDEITGEVLEEATEGTPMTIELTQAQMRKRYMEWQRGVGRKTLERKNKYTEELMADIESRMTEGDFAFIQAQFRVYDELYELANPIYRKHKGIDLPYDEFYSHLFTVGGVDIDVSGIDVMAGQMGQSFFGEKITDKDIMKRATGGSAGLKPMDDIFAVHKYIDDMSHFVGYADLATDIETLLLNADTLANLKANWGDGVVKFFRNEFSRMQRGKSERTQNPAWDWVNNVTRPLARAFLAKPTIGIKQLVSTVAYMGEVPVPHFMRYLSDFTQPANWPEIMKVMKQFRGDIMIQARGDQYEREVKAVRDAIRNTGDMLSSDEKLRASKILLGSMRLGDRGAIYVGSYIMYRFDTEVGKKGKKLTHAEAMDHFRRFTNKTQQSPDPFQLSSALSDTNAISHLLTLFTQAPTQYFNSMARTMFNAKTVSPTETARKLFVYHALLPMLWQLVANGFTWDTEEELAALILGPLAYIHIIGDGAKNFVAWGLAKVNDSKDPQWRENITAVESWVKTVGKTMDKFHELVADGGLDDEDTFTLLQDLAMATAPVTGAVGGAAQYAVGVGRGVTKVLEGEYIDALQKFLGYSDYVAGKDEED